MAIDEPGFCVTDKLSFVDLASKKWKKNVIFLLLKFHTMRWKLKIKVDVVTGGRDCPTNFNKHTLQLKVFESNFISGTL
jgi:hypothetical protein